MADYKSRGIHTSPDNAGKKNLKNAKLPKGGGYNDVIYPMREHGKSSGYTGQWSDDELQDSIDDFFLYCMENDVKPTQPLMRLWLNVSRSQMYDWRTKTDKYPGKSDIMAIAFDYMEAFLQCNIDKYPTGSIFLLKSSHGHSDKQEIQITGNDVNKDEISDTISKLGLDNKENK